MSRILFVKCFLNYGTHDYKNNCIFGGGNITKGVASHPKTMNRTS